MVEFYTLEQAETPPHSTASEDPYEQLLQQLSDQLQAEIYPIRGRKMPAAGFMYILSYTSIKLFQAYEKQLRADLKRAGWAPELYLGSPPDSQLHNLYWAESTITLKPIS